MIWVKKSKTGKQQNIDGKIHPVEISEFQVIPVIGIQIAKQRLKLFPKIRLDVDQPAIGLIYYFPELAAIDGKRQTPNNK